MFYPRPQQTELRDINLKTVLDVLCDLTHYIGHDFGNELWLFSSHMFEFLRKYLSAPRAWHGGPCLKYVAAIILTQKREKLPDATQGPKANDGFCSPPVCVP